MCEEFADGVGSFAGDRETEGAIESASEFWFQNKRASLPIGRNPLKTPSPTTTATHENPYR